MPVNRTLNTPTGNAPTSLLEGLTPDSASNEQVNPDGSMDIEFSPEEMEEMISEAVSEAEDAFYDNLLFDLEEETRDEIGQNVLESYDADEASRKDWIDILERGLKNLGLKPEQVNFPFKGACGTYHPLIIENAVKFQSKISNELLPAKGPCHVQVLGELDDVKQQKAIRIEKHLNWQTTTQMTEYYPDSERMLLYIPLMGTAFKKVYYSEALKRNCSELVQADALVIPYGASDLERACRYTHILYKSKDDYNRDIANGLYEDVDLGEPGLIEMTAIQKATSDITGITPSNNTYDYAYTFLEQHVDLYLGTDEDKHKLVKPYIVTVDKASGKVVGIRRNWKQGDMTMKKRQYFVKYDFIPGFGVYSFGLIHLLGNHQMTLTAILRSLVDAGQLANIKAGFKSRTVRMEKGAKDPLEMGEWRDIDTAGQSIRDALFPLEYGEPSQTLFNLMTYLEDRGQKFADATEQVVADSTSYGPVGTTLALLDASAKFFSALHKRLHFAQKKELQLLAQLNSEYLEDMMEVNVPGATYEVNREDYEDGLMDVCPVSDPNIPSRAYQMSLASNQVQMIQQVPQFAPMVNMRELLKRIFLAQGEENVDRLIKPEQEAQPLDPISDILAVVSGKPINAFPGQDHDAHMQVKMAWLQDPANGASQVMMSFAPIVQANVQQHMVLKYQEQMQGLVQATGAATDPQTLGMVQSQAAQKILQANAAQAQQPGSPEQIIAQAEQLKSQVDVRKQAHKEQADAATLALKANQQRLDAIKEDNRHQEALMQAAINEQQAHLDREANIKDKNLDRVSKSALEVFKTVNKPEPKEKKASS